MTIASDYEKKLALFNGYGVGKVMMRNPVEAAEKINGFVKLLLYKRESQRVRERARERRRGWR